MDKTPCRELVSIIVPVYNGENYLRRCVESILAQDYPHAEIILIDDGSTDSSGKMCDDFSGNDHRIKVHHTPNRGASAARNLGLSKVTGSFVLFVDSDDFVPPNAISALIAGYYRTHADMIVGSFNKVLPDGVVFEVRDFAETRLLTQQEIMEYAVSYLRNPRKHQLLMSSWAKLFRTSVIQEHSLAFDTGLRVAEDVAFNFDYLKKTETACFIPENVYFHQKLGTYDSLSMRILAQDPRSLFGFISALNHVRDFLKPWEDVLDVENEIGHCAVYQTVLFMVRLCGQINRKNWRMVHDLARERMMEPSFTEYIRCYVPAEGNYRLIPFLMRLRLVWPVIGVGWYEANKLYRNGCGGK